MPSARSHPVPLGQLRQGPGRMLLSGQLSEAKTTNLLELTNSRTSATGIPCELGAQVAELRDRAAALKEESQ